MELSLLISEHYVGPPLPVRYLISVEALPYLFPFLAIQLLPLLISELVYEP